MKRYAIVEKDAKTEREIERFECEDDAKPPVGMIDLWRIAIAICVWLWLVVEMVVRAIISVVAR